MKKPLIGITLDYSENKTYSKYPWYALRENYASSISYNGGVPVALAYDTENLESYLDILDGIVVTGGDFDIDPSYYGDDDKHSAVTTIDVRTNFEFLICKKFIESKKPVLGICGGQQLLNVVLGGTLIQHIPDTIENCLAHEQPNPRHEAGHEIKVIENTLLHKIVKAPKMNVNSAHHQAVKEVGENVIINSLASDGVIEGIELQDHPFCLGVQWHPEFLIDNGDRLIFKEFIEVAGNGKNS